MIDYSKLQIEVIKNLCTGKGVTNKFCYTDNEIYLKDKSNTLFVAIPKEKFILDTNKFAFNEVKGLKDLIKDDVVECIDNGLGKFIKPGLTAHTFTYSDKEFYVDSKKYKPLQFYINDRFVGMICPIKP